jgi:ATP-dependent Clp protease ATP-binding subunit ClpC
MKNTSAQYYFKDPRLAMTAVSRFIVRLTTYFTYALLVSLLIVCVISGTRAALSLGILLGLFLLHALLKSRKAECPLVRSSLKRPNVRVYMEPATLRILEISFDQVAFSGGDLVLRMLSVLIRRPEIKRALVRMDVSPDDMLLKVEEYMSKQSAYKPSKAELLTLIERIALHAFMKAKNHYGHAIEPHDLFAATGGIGNDYVERIFTLFDIKPDDLESALIFVKPAPIRLAGFFSRSFKTRHRVMNRSWSARPTPFLDQFSTDITDLARAGQSGFLVGHHQEYEQLVDILSKPGNPNALLIGEPGSGRETIIHHLAFQMVKDRVPKPLFDKRLVSLEIGSLFAGAAAGEIEARVKRIVYEIAVSKNIILYIPDMHNLVKTTGTGTMTAADVLIPAIRSMAFSVVGATYPREYKQLIEPNTDFASSFEPVRVQELSESEAVQYLVYASLVLEQQYGVTTSFGAVKKAVSIAKKYFRTKLLPSSAEDLLKEALADAQQNHRDAIGVSDIISIAERKINVPLREATKDEAQTLLNLEDTIHKKFIDQDEAVKAVSRSLREYRSGLSRKGGPIAVFLFVGPTGVGKTELSKMLAEIQFGSREMMIRFDMTEYQDKQSSFRLIGSPDGQTRGTLTDAVLEKPYSLILLDEFEKANPDVLNLFLQVFDDGRLTDNLGRTVQFDNTIIIATSNAHSAYIKEETEKGTPMAQVAESLKRKLTDFFKPELLNRFSDVIVFKNLSKEDTKAIARLNLKDLVTALSAAQAIDLTFDESAVSAVAEQGYDPVFGARPLRNVISQKLRSVLAELILKGEIKKGDALTCVFENEQFVFKKVTQ